MFFIGISARSQNAELQPLFHMAILKKEGGEIAVESLQTVVKPFYKEPQDGYIATGLGGSDLFIRKLQLPLSDRRKILAALPFQLESLLPISIEEAIVCPQLKSVGKQMTAATLFVTSQESLQKHLAELKSAEICTDAISCMPAALVRFAHWQFPKTPRIIAFHLQANEILYTVSENGDLVLSQTLPCAPNAPLQLEKIAIYLKQKGAIDDETPWLLAGQPSESGPFAQIFSGPHLLPECADHALYALPIGLALDALLQDERTLQFCKKKFIPEHTQARRTQKLLSYLAICALGTIGVLIGSSLALKGKQKKILAHLKKELPSSLSLPAHAPTEEIETVLHKWDRSIAGKRSSFPFQPSTPKVSDVLAWLSTHPSFTAEDSGKKEGIEIKSLHYQLLKYPKIGDANAPYLATVSLDFTADTPRLARDFHEDLLKGKSIVNAKKEIRWHAHNQNYQASFELNREPLP